ncbi:serine/arginine repetitive matrix protein 2-like [Formica exsecta]|uniref:serine/arginine repetitive matrix protein 2-like n=1 Tax=Formica exsecta TaxID=72781 RepID=UPI001141A068|nr:serine/arginine repetitive matrix protein 2-like [Formica exsecta]
MLVGVRRSGQHGSGKQFGGHIARPRVVAGNTARRRKAPGPTCKWKAVRPEYSVSRFKNVGQQYGAGRRTIIQDATDKRYRHATHGSRNRPPAKDSPDATPPVIKRRKVEESTLRTSSSRPLGARSPTASGARPPSSGAKSPASSGARPPSTLSARSSSASGARPPSSSAKSPASSGARPPSALSPNHTSGSRLRLRLPQTIRKHQLQTPDHQQPPALVRHHQAPGRRLPLGPAPRRLPVPALRSRSVTVSDGSLSPIGADSPEVSGLWPPFSGHSKENARSGAQSPSISHAERNQRRKDRPISLLQLERILASPAKTWKLPPLISPIKILPIREPLRRRHCGTQTSPVQVSWSEENGRRLHPDEETRGQIQAHVQN